jgi:hypothetical protein
MLDCLLVISQKIDGTNKTMEIGESKFDGLKCNRELKLKGQCVFVGVKRESGKYISSSLLDRTADTLMAVLRDWVEPGTQSSVTAGRHTET